MGYRPGGWERLQPVELYAVRDAEEWRRARDLGALAYAAAAIANRIPFAKGVKHEELAATMIFYEPPEEGPEGDDGREG